jgi:hypothetical protein
MNAVEVDCIYGVILSGAAWGPADVVCGVSEAKDLLLHLADRSNH